MKISSISLLSHNVFVVICLLSWASSAVRSQSDQDFFQCLYYTSISELTYTQDNSSYLSTLEFTIQNLRFISPSTPKPLAIITPLYEYQIPPIIYCSKNHDMQIKIRSGGHDYEGISYTSNIRFVILDMINLRSVDVDVANETVWVQSGAILEELYDSIANKSLTLAFPAGVCPLVGVGGYLSGGGYGLMTRKYGLGADNVIDARIVDVNGRILDRSSMGEDLFWAIRGSGGASFGVILAWKLNLVSVPEKVTTFVVLKTLEQNAAQLIHRWQYIAHNFHEDLSIVINIDRVNSAEIGTGMTIQAQFSSLFLGGVDRLLPLMQESFPELGLTREDCTERSWIDAMRYLGEGLYTKQYFKAKSDYVKEPIPIEAFEGIWTRYFTDEGKKAQITLFPYGGKMAEISETALPYPHRAGNIYKFQHVINWEEEDAAESEKYITWMRELYEYLAPYVSNSPREAYMNYRDLDLGVNNDIGNTSYAQASIWGTKYFLNNFLRLARVKTMVDPSNFFRNEQSIPLLIPVVRSKYPTTSISSI